MAGLPLDPPPGRLDPAVEGAVRDIVRAEVQEAVHDLLVMVGVLDSELEDVRRPVLKGTEGRDPHVIAVPLNTDARKKMEMENTNPAPSMQERLALMVKGWSPGTTARVAVFLVFVWWGTVQGGCNEVLSTTRHLATEVRHAYVGTAAAAAEAVDTDLEGPVRVDELNGRLDAQGPVLVPIDSFDVVPGRPPYDEGYGHGYDDGRADGEGGPSPGTYYDPY